MKKIIMIGMFGVCSLAADAQSLDRDSLTTTIESIYKQFMPFLDRVEISGNSEASMELRQRWNNVLQYLKNNKGSMTEEVKNLLIAPSGKPIDLELVKKFININRDDSVPKISINPDVLLDELKFMGDRLKDIGIKMAEQNK
mgnify:CR=1 FL=1